MAPAHDPYRHTSTATRTRPLPAAFEHAAAAGATPAELAAAARMWWRGSDNERAGAEAIIAEFTPGDWAEFVEGWRNALDQAGGDVDAIDGWYGDDDQDATSEPQAHAVGPSGDDGAVGGDGITGFVGGDVEGWQELLADRIDLEPVADGFVRVAFYRDDVDTDAGGNPMGYGMTGDVPVDAKAAVAFLAGDDLDPADVTDTPDAQGDRARLVLTAELTRPVSARRKTVLDAVAEVLAPAEVEERTRVVDNPEQVTEAPADGG